MRLSARQGHNLDAREVLVIKPIIRPRLDAVTFVGAAVEDRRHDLALLFFLAVLE
jgi:hypothetical protein